MDFDADGGVVRRLELNTAVELLSQQRAHEVGPSLHSTVFGTHLG